MEDILAKIDHDDAWRAGAFPVTRDRIFLAHAAVTTLPRAVADAMKGHIDAMSTGELPFSKDVTEHMDAVRKTSADFLGCQPGDIALIGPTSVGLSLVANGFPWEAGDEVLCYLDDYPANVYPWQDLRRHGITVTYLKPDSPGEFTPELVERSLTPETRMVALASCNFLTGYRIDVNAIGKLLRDRGIFFCLDGIQSIGGFRTPLDFVDFMSADSHKWMLGPVTAGIFFVREELQSLLRPSLLGAWNIRSPNFIAREEITFEQGGRQYEPGVLNTPGFAGMKAGLELLAAVGIENIEARLLGLKAHLLEGLDERGFTVTGPRADHPAASSITAVSHPDRDLQKLFEFLNQENVVTSFRFDREGRSYIRFSPHFYNTAGEIDRVFELIDTRA